ncbi:unnamed protein product [Clavelina lepadiformis]|uniref:Rap guanine nucleotide exchange factor 2 n=1 Tax=Clavelina lepadiformis TaxID=159417 RepID=A0ABP0FH12_CLALP
MIAIDYPDMPVHAGGLATRPHALRHSISTTLSSSSQSTLDNVAEGDSSSSEGSPLHISSENNLHNAANGQAVMMTDSISQSSLSKDTDGDDFDDHELDEEDSISLHSTSSLVIKDQVIDVLKKETDDRNQDDLETLMEFTKSLRAFSNMTEPVRRALCNVMIFAWVPKANTTVLKDDELLDSWSVIINGQVQVQQDGDDVILSMGDSFGVSPSLEEQRHKGAMHTITDDCQFLCIAQQQYYDILHQGEENIENIYSEKGDLVLVKEKRESDGTKQGNIVIRGNPEHLMRHLLDENTIDATFAEDFLLTYRAFFNEPLKICRELLRRCDNKLFRDKVTRTILLWVNNHFSDFEGDWRMMELLEEFEEKLNRFNLHGETKLFNIACSAKAKPRSVSFTRSSCEADLGFKILGGSENNFPIYVSQVSNGSTAESKGVKRGDQLMEVNGQNFEKLSHERAQAILKKNTELTLTLKTSLFAFKEMMTELANPQPKTKKESKFSHSLRRPRVSITNDGEVFDKHKKGSTLSGKTKKLISKFAILPKFPSFDGGESQVTVDDNYLVPGRVYTRGSSATIDSFRPIKKTQNISLSNPDLLDPNALEMSTLPEIPEDVIKVYRVDQTCRFIFVSRDTTAGDAVQMACREFGITEEVHNYALYKVSVQGEKFVKQSKLPEPLAKLADMPLGSRYYLKNMMNSEQLLPDENIPELLKEANFSFLDLNCFEVALYLTREDYKLFQLTEPTNFIEDLFGLNTELKKFKQFEDLVNRELFWVVTTLCKEQSVILRSKIVKHFTKIAHHCKLLKNLNSTFALISGLGYRAVSRMKQSWERVPAKSNRLFEELQALMDPSRNMSKYRTLLNEYVSQPPVIPYVPVVKKDLTFLHLGNDTKVDGLINFEKMRMIAKEVRGICRLCAPDHQQILPSAVAAQQKETDRGAYQTLARRGRRSSFNNARRMYEDQMNVRRVRQYMQQIDIISDEDKLMEMSKNVEPSASNSNQMKRPKNSNTLSSDSPSRSSKTLPPQAGRSSSTGSNSSLQSRNNSEPHLNLIPNLTLPATRKKTPSSTLPKYGVDFKSFSNSSLNSLDNDNEVVPRIKVPSPLLRRTFLGKHFTTNDGSRHLCTPHPMHATCTPHSSTNTLKPPSHTRTASGSDLMLLKPEPEAITSAYVETVPDGGSSGLSPCERRTGRSKSRSLLKNLRFRSKSLSKTFKPSTPKVIVTEATEIEDVHDNMEDKRNSGPVPTNPNKYETLSESVSDCSRFFPIGDCHAPKSDKTLSVFTPDQCVVANTNRSRDKARTFRKSFSHDSESTVEDTCFPNNTDIFSNTSSSIRLPSNGQVQQRKSFPALESTFTQTQLEPMKYRHFCRNKLPPKAKFAHSQTTCQPKTAECSYACQIVEQSKPSNSIAVTVSYTVPVRTATVVGTVKCNHSQIKRSSLYVTLSRHPVSSGEIASALYSWKQRRDHQQSPVA